MLRPLTEFPRESELVERLYARVAGRGGASLGEEAARGADIFPGWEFEAMRMESARGSLFELREQPVVILDEPDVLGQTARKFLERLGEAYGQARKSADLGVETAPPETYAFTEAEWQRSLEAVQQLLIEQLPIHREGDPPRVLPSQPTTRYHGNIAAFMS